MANRLNWTPNPCRICLKRKSIGVLYGPGEWEDAETRWFCWDHIPDEFHPEKLRLKLRAQRQ